MSLRIFWRLRRERKLRHEAESRLAKECRRHEARFEAEKAFYEKRLASERKRAELREDALTDRVMQSFKLMGVSSLTMNLEDKIELPPSIDESETASESDFVLTNDQQDYVDQYKDNFYRMGHEQNRSEVEISTLWNSRFKNEAIAQSLDIIEQ